MSAERRLAHLLGMGGKVNLEIDGQEGHLLIDALEMWADDYRATMGQVPPDDAGDAQADSEALARAHDLSQRIYVLLGYTRRPR